MCTSSPRANLVTPDRCQDWNMKGKGEITHRADLAAEKLQMWIRRIIEAKLDLSCGPPMCAYNCVNSVNVPETVPEVSEHGLYLRGVRGNCWLPTNKYSLSRSLMATWLMQIKKCIMGGIPNECKDIIRWLRLLITILGHMGCHSKQHLLSCSGVATMGDKCQML